MTEQCKQSCRFTLKLDEEENKFNGKLFCILDKGHDGIHAYHHTTFNRIKPQDMRA